MPRSKIIQANSKHRPIDDGSRCGHNEATAYVETLDCVSAVQSAVHAKVLMEGSQAKGAGAVLREPTARTWQRRPAGRVQVGS